MIKNRSRHTRTPFNADKFKEERILKIQNQTNSYMGELAKRIKLTMNESVEGGHPINTYELHLKLSETVIQPTLLHGTLKDYQVWSKR